MPELAIEEYRVAQEPYYLPVNKEIDLFEGFDHVAYGNMNEMRNAITGDRRRKAPRN